ncbi:MAG TPA: peptidoglycan DD-metalloendopeptidase family protein [Bacteroidales bacterium]|nr:peptidoglycan DD-metalloendopeptidase family protein [Bacteroidales bacterium]
MTKNKKGYHSFQWEDLYLKPYKATKRYIIIALGVLGTALALSFIFTLIAIYIFPSKIEQKKANELNQLITIYQEAQENQKQIENLLDSINEKNAIISKNIFNTELTEESTENDRYKKLKDANNLQDLLDIISADIKIIEQKSNIQSYYYSFLYHYLPKNLEKFNNFPIRMPLDSTYEIASGFGERIHPILKNKFLHTGIDFAAPVRTPVYATANGIVRNPDPTMFGYGETIIIDHGNNISSLYAHLLEKKVSAGRRVSAGDLIGYVGNTGIAFGVHLHYEIRIKNKPVDPIKFIININPQTYYHYYQQAKVYNQALS